MNKEQKTDFGKHVSDSIKRGEKFHTGCCFEAGTKLKHEHFIDDCRVCEIVVDVEVNMRANNIRLRLGEAIKKEVEAFVCFKEEDKSNLIHRTGVYKIIDLVVKK